MDKALVVFGLIVAALAAAAAFALWRQEPSAPARVEVEALAERQSRPVAAKKPARSAERHDRYRGP